MFNSLMKNRSTKNRKNLIAIEKYLSFYIVGMPIEKFTKFKLRVISKNGVGAS